MKYCRKSASRCGCNRRGQNPDDEGKVPHEEGVDGEFLGNNEGILDEGLPHSREDFQDNESSGDSQGTELEDNQAAEDRFEESWGI